MSATGRVEVCRSEEIPEGQSRAFEVESKSVLFCRSKGVLFDLKTGAPRGALTSVPIQTFEVREADDR